MTVPQATVGTMGTNKVRLSAEEVAQSKSLGISLVEYARLRQQLLGRDLFSSEVMGLATKGQMVADPNFTLQEIEQAQDLIADLTKDSK